ncbi:MAG: type II toxin-antitoxin system PrlF family antitoxin [Methanobacteriaceae archaeon]
MIAETNIYSRYQTVIPKEIRKKVGIKKNQVIEWNINKNGKVELSFREKISHDDVKGMINLKEKTNAVKLVKDLYKKGDKQ